jgi:cell fate (sporulation/competence/biofilm development) regulator YlbF (YheA/YmcA/DUF963 family)
MLHPPEFIICIRGCQHRDHLENYVDAIVEMAGRLGKAIADSPQATKLRTAREELNRHGDLIQLLKDYQAQIDKVAKVEQEKKPVEVDDKHRLQDLQAKLVGSEVFKALTAAQVGYIDLMHRVNAEMRKHLGEIEK